MSTPVSLGFDPYFEAQLASLEDPSLAAARISIVHRGRYGLLGSRAAWAELGGRLRHHSTAADDLPAVGDWVAIRDGDGIALIEAVLPRRTAFVRRAAGRRTEAQVIAANLDVVFVVAAANRDFNPRRVERYLTVAWDSGAIPVVVLNKIDLHDDVGELVEQLEHVAFGVSVVAVSATTGAGIDAVRAHVGPGRTAGLVGSSGVGKSSLVNRLLGAQRQLVSEIRESDDRGRHTTTHRELVPMPGDGLLIDTPGMRELALWDDGDGLAQTFADVEALAATCRFRDCQHAGEPGCAVATAIDEGELDATRLASYHKLRREQAHLERHKDPAAEGRHKQKWKAVTKAMRVRSKLDPKLGGSG